MPLLVVAIGLLIGVVVCVVIIVVLIVSVDRIAERDRETSA